MNAPLPPSRLSSASANSSRYSPANPVGPVVVATHGHCFDGMASAVMFTHLLSTLEPATRDRGFRYCGQAYDHGKNGVDASVFADASASAILDFRYTSLDALTWYFDHHASAFPSPSDRDHFELLAAQGRGFYDAHAGSCTKLIATIGKATFGLEFGPFEELIRWADMIDTASFPTPEMAVERREPEMQLLAVIEQQGDDALLAKLVSRLLERPLTEVANAPDIVARYAPIGALHRQQVERIRLHEQRRGPVVFVDLLDANTETVTKFVTYADVPDAPYSVVASRTTHRCKISVGYNPWSGVARVHDIAKICERYGGGGHAVVGAIALAADVDKCRAIALDIVRELGGG